MNNPDADATVIGPNAIWCRFTFQWRERSVAVDRDACIIVFFHCHVPRRFLAIAQPSFRCSAADIQTTYLVPRFRNSPGGLTVVTTTGRAFISERGTNFAELRKWFLEAAPANLPDFSTDNPLFGCVYSGSLLIGLLSGLFLALFLAPNSDSATLVMAAVFGAVIGIVGSYQLISYGMRVCKHDFVKPISYTMVGAMLGASACGLLQRVLGWNLPVFLVIIVSTAILGGMGGLRARHVKQDIGEPSGEPEPPTTPDLDS